MKQLISNFIQKNITELLFEPKLGSGSDRLQPKNLTSTVDFFENLGIDYLFHRNKHRHNPLQVSYCKDTAFLEEDLAELLAPISYKETVQYFNLCFQGKGDDGFKFDSNSPTMCRLNEAIIDEMSKKLGI